MLLPSDVARLVLGYLQEEGLCATSQAFIHESCNLKEYAEHTTPDGTIPACVFSIFGKGLSTILNEYVAAKTKESCHEVPVMMTSLWKKLDFTVNQIKSLQNSPAVSASQRTRSRVGLANMARQRVLTVSSTGAETSSIISPAHSMFSHSTPVSYSAPHIRQALGSGTPQQIHDGSRLLSISRDSPVHIIVSENRLNPGPMSPGRRKWDTPRKRGGAQSGTSGPGRSATAVSSVSAEPQPEEVVNETFPQLVIQNARDTILGDRSLQEKLAENINKILANEPTPQTSKASSATMETDPSIDEILGLQGEIHMSDDAIHDILEQTESDPAFQALFDLFDYNKSKIPDGEPGDEDVSSSPEESDAAGSSLTFRPLLSEGPGTTQMDINVSDTNPVTMKTRVGQDRRTRKSAPSTLLKKTLLAPRGKASRIEGSSARLLVSHGEQRGVSPPARKSNRKERASLFKNSVAVTPMDIDEPLNTPPPPSDSMASSEPATKDSTFTTGLCESVPSSRVSTALVASLVMSTSNVEEKEEHKQAQHSTEQPTVPSLALGDPPDYFSPVQVELTPVSTVDLSAIAASSDGGDTHLGCTHSVTLESASSNATVTALPALPSASPVAPFRATPDSPMCASASTTLTATPTSSTPASPTSFSFCAPVASAPDPSSTNVNPQSKAAAHSSNIVSLNIIISDSQDEELANDAALNQAISSISGDKMPTIYLSSPAKSLGYAGVPGTPKNNLDEVAQAVSSLQGFEATASPLTGKAVGLLASPLSRTSQGHQSYVIQLPLDTANPCLPGATASYILVTEPPTAEAQSRRLLLPAGVSKGQPLLTNQFGATPSTYPQGYSTGSALILPSPVKPLMLPITVMGQNSLGNVQMVSNQLVAIPNPVLVQQPETVSHKPSTVAVKKSTVAGSEETVVGEVIQPASGENTSQQDAAKSSSHRRILFFDSSAGVQLQTPETTKTTSPAAPNTSTPRSVKQPGKVKTQLAPQIRPAILSGDKPKRRIEITRCSSDSQNVGGLVKEGENSRPQQQHHKGPVKKNSRKQDHKINNPESRSASASRVGSSQPEALKKLESGRRSKSIEKKHTNDDGEAKAHNSQRSRMSSDTATKSGNRKDKEESSRKEPSEKALAKSREGRTEKRIPSQETPNVTANKENEIKGRVQEQQQQSTSASSTSSDLNPPAVTQPESNPQSKATKAQSKSCSLAKQAAEMLQDIQELNSPSTPAKRPGASTSDISLPSTPGTGYNQEESTDTRHRTPSRQKRGNDGEGPQKRLLPPNTPDVPTCSPASEAGSENSINMAAHTLMILSRAAIARTGTPLKDSLRQDGVGEKSPTSSKISKKRKQSSPTASTPAKKESKRSPGIKNDREKKKVVDCFPHDLDVDKFLSSLHYDE
ncbi:protein NPAT [Pleuronectes platessa]|uniref:protein NPAT n=1 Tax=Pleuronectes platessa TaxID=8262 RepID=UPI00232A561B|nr:protein NPAT [Pleuronectes platessa]